MEKLQTIIIRQAIKLLSLIPAGLIDRLSFFLGRLWFSVDPYHRKIADSNMEKAFGNELTQYERKKLVKDNFVQLVRVALEIPSILKLDKENINSFVRFEGIENLQNAYL